MRFLIAPRRKYRPRFFWWADVDSIGAGAVLAAFMWLWIYGLPFPILDGLGDELRAQLHQLGITTGGR
jgi:hypothetical protein